MPVKKSCEANSCPAVDMEDGPDLGRRMAPFPYIAKCNFLQREKTLVFPFKFNSA